uniref:Putative secreted protein n=1 Tax=Ixodes ricinus TaxID=34613 RepID=A0A0K8R824_IXORI
MKATKLLLILAFHFAAGGFSVIEMSGQEFFDRALQAAVYAYSLDPMEMEFVRDIDSVLASLKIYQLTAHGLSTVQREGANFISVNNSGASLKIDIAAKKHHGHCSSKCYCRNIYFFIYSHNQNRCPRKLHSSSTGYRTEKCGIKSGSFQYSGSRDCGSEVHIYRRLFLGIHDYSDNHRIECQKFLCGNTKRETTRCH